MMFNTSSFLLIILCVGFTMIHVSTILPQNFQLFVNVSFINNLKSVSQCTVNLSKPNRLIQNQRGLEDKNLILSQLALNLGEILVAPLVPLVRPRLPRLTLLIVGAILSGGVLVMAVCEMPHALHVVIRE